MRVLVRELLVLVLARELLLVLLLLWGVLGKKAEQRLGCPLRQRLEPSVSPATSRPPKQTR